MRGNRSFIGLAIVTSGLCFLTGCSKTSTEYIHIEAENFDSCVVASSRDSKCLELSSDQYATYTIDIPVTGRYHIWMRVSSDQGVLWVEDYIYNQDGRTYNITGDMSVQSGTAFDTVHSYGSPMAKGRHHIKLHSKKQPVNIDWLRFEPMIIHDSTNTVMTQQMTGDNWTLVWSDEFEESGMPDTSKWSYNIGNWGWGNNELQYYTNANPNNARVENGQLVIQAHLDTINQTWTSARLTTQGKFGFTYGKIEIRAKVPHNRGTWAAGWMLGSSYKDELSWPYCGEIDILECVGFEIDDTTYTGLNHATCHTRKYYFKQGNQIGADTTLHHMTDLFHTYAVEWYPNVIYGLVDGHRYYRYDKNKDELEWPFNNPQDIILNLAIGGGWGGAKGLDSTFQSASYVIDYVRVYDLK